MNQIYRAPTSVFWEALLPNPRTSYNGPSRFRKLRTTLRIWHERRESRVILSQLDQRMLDDVGLTQAQADIESAKPFWRD